MKHYFFEKKEKESAKYTDLAVERRRADITLRGVEYKSYESEGYIWECVRVFSEEGARSIGKPMGRYYTLNTGRLDLIDESEMWDISEELAKKLCEIFDSLSVIPSRLLVVGLGNRSLTPDSIGPKSADEVKPTLHISRFDDEMFEALECSEIAVYTPDVSAHSGLDSTESVCAICESIMPDALIVIDAITTLSRDRLGSTFQLCDTGISQGSGIGNSRLDLNEDTVGVPVISIGVPTVIDSRAFSKEEVSRQSKKEDGMLVAPKEIDEITSIASRIIGGAINQAFGINTL